MSEKNNIKYTCVNVSFVNRNNKHDETQLTTKDIRTNVGRTEMQELLDSLSEEMNADFSPTAENVLYSFEIVAEAYSEEMLEEMGY